MAPDLADRDELEAAVGVLAGLVQELASALVLVAGSALRDTEVWPDVDKRVERVLMRSTDLVVRLKAG